MYTHLCIYVYVSRSGALRGGGRAGWASITKVGGSDRNRNVIEPIETKTFTQTRRRVQAAGPAWVWGPEDRSNIETEIPNHVEIESIEPRPTLQSVAYETDGVAALSEAPPSACHRGRASSPAPQAAPWTADGRKRSNTPVGPLSLQRVSPPRDEVARSVI